MTELYTALLKAKQKINPPSKNRKAVYGRYADLEAVLQAVEKPLAEEGLVLVQSGVFKEGVNFLETRLVHVKTGQSITSDIPLAAKDLNDPQKLGGSITYARRYGITAILSIVADDDDDGNTGAGKAKDGTPIAPPKTGAAKLAEVLPGKMVDALFREFQAAGFSEKEAVLEMRALLKREFKMVSELTEAEARAAVSHARKVKAGEAARLNVPAKSTN